MSVCMYKDGYNIWIIINIRLRFKYDIHDILHMFFWVMLCYTAKG